MKKIISLLISVVLASTAAVGLSGCTNKANSKLVWYVFGDKPADHDTVMERQMR